MSQKSLHPKHRLTSFGYAFNGIKSLIAQEPNAKIHLAGTLAAIGFGLFRHISKMEWIALVVVIAIVWIAEALNTCVEMLCDLWCKEEFHPKVKIIKDIAAGAVLVAALCAVITACFIFL